MKNEKLLPYISQPTPILPLALNMVKQNIGRKVNQSEFPHYEDMKPVKADSRRKCIILQPILNPLMMVEATPLLSLHRP